MITFLQYLYAFLCKRNLLVVMVGRLRRISGSIRLSASRNDGRQAEGGGLVDRLGYKKK